MQAGPSTRTPKYRQACELCRRKKIRCNGERPVCWHCLQSEQQCLYLPREAPRTVIGSRKFSKDRVHRLEEQIGDLYNIIQTLSYKSPPQRSIHISPGVGTSAASHEESSPSEDHSTEHGHAFSPSSPEPPSHVLEHFVNLYVEKIHVQPLPLFDPEKLLNHLSASPRYLLWSFMAVVLHFGTHPFYRDNEAQAVSFYIRSANESCTKLAADGIARTEVLQATCLLAMRNILSGKLNRAWMIIGSAGRLFLLRKQTIGELDHLLEEDLSRCFWSIYLLERTFSSNAVQLSDINSPRRPPSACLPPTIASTGNGTHSPDFLDDNNPVRDFGINYYYLDLAGVWGKLLIYLQELRNGKVEESWTSESMYARLRVALYERDTRLCTKHLLRHTNFGSRTREELSTHRQYWHPWIAMQLFSHAIPAILNHPFIHLSALRDGTGGAARSRFFLQQTVDTALLHSAWVARLLQMCDELGFEIQSPLIGDVVASTATVAWLFQFTGDAKTRSTATENFKTFQTVLSRLSVSWPNLSTKVELLRALQTISDEKARESTESSRSISFPPMILWDILAPLHGQNTKGAVQSPDTTHSEYTLDTRLRVRTQYTHPLTENHAAAPAVVTDSFAEDVAVTGTQMGELAELSIDDLLTQLPEQDFFYPGYYQSTM